MAASKPKDKDEGAASGAPAGWAAPLTRPATRFVIAGLVVLFNLPLLHYYLFRATPEVAATLPWHDDFSQPSTVAAHYWSSGGHWRVVEGQLLSPGVKNNPLWLEASLPHDVAVEFDVRSMSPEGDIKCEIFGDGSDHASGYVLINGGWNNSLNVIARLDEHGPSLSALQAQASQQGGDLVTSGVYTAGTRTRVEARTTEANKVQLGRTYHWRIERRGRLLSWSIDGQPMLTFDDPFPLGGKGHDRFGFSSWEAQLFFDNLTVTPL